MYILNDFFVLGEIALQQENWDEAIALLKRAISVEDQLPYGEPPQWLQPARHTLGAVYLNAGKPEDAERVYRKDLEKWKANGWSLYGLSQALEAQGKSAEAADVRAQFNAAWANADRPIETSCLCLE